jgi:hypothetical protein
MAGRNTKTEKKKGGTSKNAIQNREGEKKTEEKRDQGHMALMSDEPRWPVRKRSFRVFELPLSRNAQKRYLLWGLRQMHVIFLALGAAADVRCASFLSFVFAGAPCLAGTRIWCPIQTDLAAIC